ncbi:MAG: ketopantoate reductase family protein [Thermoplasmata archaeon]
MRINIIGPGAMGIILSYYLHKKNDVLLIVKEEDIDKYSDIKVIDEEREQKILVRVSSKMREADLTIVAVKSYDLENALDTYNPKGKVLFIQNGLKHINIERGGMEKFFAVTTWAGRRIEKGRVEITGRGYFRIGGKGNLDLTVFRDSGINAEWSDNIIQELYRKASINSVINPITAIFKVRNGSILENPYLWSIARIVAAENKALLEKMGYDINVENDVNETCRVTSKNVSSMLQDVMNNKRTEIESISGELVRLGEKYGMNMPLNRMMLNAILFLEEKLSSKVTV